MSKNIPLKPAVKKFLNFYHKRTTINLRGSIHIYFEQVNDSIYIVERYSISQDEPAERILFLTLKGKYQAKVVLAILNKIFSIFSSTGIPESD